MSEQKIKLSITLLDDDGEEKAVKQVELTIEQISDIISKAVDVVVTDRNVAVGDLTYDAVEAAICDLDDILAKNAVVDPDE